MYGALELEVDASVAGAVDEALPGVTPGEVQSALREALGPLRPRAVDPRLLERARALTARHAAV